MLNFKQSDYDTMMRVQKQLAEVLNRANRDHVEAGLAAFALVRLARELVNKYPDETRSVLVDQLIVPFLQNEPVDSRGGIVMLH